MAYAPTALTFNSYGWKGGNAYNARDIPMDASVTDRTATEQMYAYEWFDSSNRFATRRNPPFSQGTAGRLVPSLADEGIPNRILRGFIRRAEYDAADAKSGARLYFMYNPEQITRDYVSYLDQGALDPFNTVFQSGNLVPPPSFMDFTFSLLFDRQEEAQASRHPGVFVDYEFFDLVVRNITPVTDPNDVSTTLPDNGVMMVNPRDITVVFSPQITVQGRPSNARVNFQRFTHRMVPTRMQIDLTMRVTYFGPMKDMTTYPGEEAATAEKIPWDITSPSPFTITRAEIQEAAGLFMEQMSANMLSPEEIKTMIALAEKANALSPGTGDRWLANNAGQRGAQRQHRGLRPADVDRPPHAVHQERLATSCGSTPTAPASCGPPSLATTRRTTPRWARTWESASPTAPRAGRASPTPRRRSSLPARASSRPCRSGRPTRRAPASATR